MSKPILAASLCVLLVSAYEMAAQETVNLSAPVITVPDKTSLRVARVELNVLLGTVQVTMLPWAGGAFVLDARPLNVVYDATTTPTGASLLVALNKADLTTISLEKRILQQLIKSKHLAGVIEGTPP